MKNHQAFMASTKIYIAYSIATLLACIVIVYGVQYHIMALTISKEVSIPRLASIHTLERTKQGLLSQAEVLSLQEATADQTNNEMVQAYIVPKVAPTDRFVLALQLLAKNIEAYGETCTIHSITIGDALSAEAIGMRVPLTIEFTASAPSYSTLVSFLESAGVLTVYDALRPADREALLTYTEQENPAAITELEAFFAHNLYEFTVTSDATIQRLLRSFSVEGFAVAMKHALKAPLFVAAQWYSVESIRTDTALSALLPIPIVQIDSIQTTLNELGTVHNGTIQISLFFTNT